MPTAIHRARIIYRRATSASAGTEESRRRFRSDTSSQWPGSRDQPSDQHFIVDQWPPSVRTDRPLPTSITHRRCFFFWLFVAALLPLFNACSI